MLDFSYNRGGNPLREGKLMDEINLKELFRYILAKFYVVILVLIAVLSAGVLYSVYLKTPMYKSSTKVVLTYEKNADTATITTNDVQLSNNLVKTYSEIVKSQSVLSKVANNLKLEGGAEALASKLTVVTAANTQLITVTVADADAEKAKTIADEIAKVFKAEIVSLYKIDNVQIVDKAQAASEPYNIDMMASLLKYLAAGVAVGIGVVLLMFYLDNTIKSSQIVEDKVGLVVLGVVPEMEKK